MIHIEPIPAFNDNYIWCIYDDDSGKAAVVDPGEAGPVEEALLAQQLELEKILITHHHFDHTGGIEALTRHRDIPVYGPKNHQIASITHRLDEQSSMSLFDLNFTILEVPGHTLDHIALYCEDTGTGQPVLFCGDTLFAGGCGRIFEGNPTMMLNSLQKLAALPPTTEIYCAHEYTLGNLAFANAVEPNNTALNTRIRADKQRREDDIPTVPSLLATELATNPFLRCTEDTVIDSVKAQGGSNGDSEVDIFTAVRRWKDNF